MHTRTTGRRSVVAAGLGLVGSLSTPGLRGEGLPEPKKAFRFPVDHGVHAGFPWESWHIAGTAKDGLQNFGFQVTFFRTAVGGIQRWYAHACVTDVANRGFVHDQQVNGTGVLARLSVAQWSIGIEPKKIITTVKSKAFGFALVLIPRQAALLHGEDGVVQQGAGARQVSYQYSLPQCTAEGSLTLDGRDLKITGDAWLTHDWRHDLAGHPAEGRDAFTMNLFDGSFVHAFQMRNKSGERLWDGGVLRTGKGQRFVFRRGSVEFSRQKTWKSRLTEANYPVEWIVRTPADFYTVRATIPHQELDSRPATSGIYWKGLADLFDSNGLHIGRGCLEMTGYAKLQTL